MKRFQFSIRTLLILTALAAVACLVARVAAPILLLMLGVMLLGTIGIGFMISLAWMISLFTDPQERGPPLPPPESP